MTQVTVSYDVFDTVVTRDFAHPRDLFVHLGARLGDPDPFTFARARWEAELAARKKASTLKRGQGNAFVSSPEVTFDEIYAELAARLGWDEITTRAAQALELTIESHHLHAVPSRPDELARARRETGKLVFLSDQYLPASVLSGWLQREGLAEVGDLVLMSGETRANKSSGRLFETARAAVGGEFTHWRHTGDHPFADVESPRRLGIVATHFTAAQLTEREWQARGTRDEFAPPWRSFLAGAMRLARLDGATHLPTGQPGLELKIPTAGNSVNSLPRAIERRPVIWETGATVAGPLFYGFVRWTLLEATRRDVKRLYFLARDGQIFLRIAETIQALENIPIECRYLHASRLLFAGPAELEAPAALRLLAAPTGQFHSRRQTLLHLNLEEEDLPVALRTADIETNLPTPEREALADWLLAPERGALLRAASERRAQQARAYLTQEGVSAGEPIAVVDTGWFGTIQRSLEHLLDSPLTGFYLGVMPSAGRPTSGPALGYTNQFSPLPLQREESHKVLIELFARSDHGSAVGFCEPEQDPASSSISQTSASPRSAGVSKPDHIQGNSPGRGRITVQLGPPGPVALDEIYLLQRAILAFTHRALAVEREASVPEAERACATIELYRAFHDAPSKAEACVLGFTPHSDQYLEQRHATLCAPLTLRKTFTALTDYRQRPPHWWIGGQAAIGHGWLLRSFRFLKMRWWKLRRRAE